MSEAAESVREKGEQAEVFASDEEFENILGNLPQAYEQATAALIAKINSGEMRPSPEQAERLLAYLDSVKVADKVALGVPTATGLAEAEAASPARKKRLTFLGLGAPQWLLAGLMIGSIGWASWATAEILALQKREIVSISLSTILRDFVSVESMRNQTQEQATARTREFLAGVEKQMGELREGGKVVLLSEAVAGKTVRDITPEVMDAVRAGLPSTESSLSPSAVVPFPSGRAPEGRVVEPVPSGAGQ